MKIIRPRNIKNRGIMEFLFYRERSRYVGVCLTFNIIEEGDNLEEVKRSVEEAAYLHLTVVARKKLSDDLLNRYAPSKYWEKYFALQKELSKQKIEVTPREQNTIASSSTRYTLNDILSKQRVDGDFTRDAARV